jgi:hypothetical protein
MRTQGDSFGRLAVPVLVCSISAVLRSQFVVAQTTRATVTVQTELLGPQIPKDFAHAAGKPIGICGQAPSDFPEFAEWLMERGIDPISLNPDTAIKTAVRVSSAEHRALAVAR